MGFTYGADGNVATITDPLGRSQHFAYDAFGRVISRTLVDGRVVGFEYDEAGRTIAVTPPGRSPYTFSWTPRGQLAAFAPPAIGGEEREIRFTYDADAALTRVQRPGGTGVEYVYDSAGRVERVILSSGAQHLYTYDPADRIESITVPDGTLSYTWDGPLLTGMTWTGAVAGSVTRSYDDGLRVASLAVNGDAIAYAYDDDGYLVAAGDLTLTRAADSGLVTGATLGGVVETFVHDAFGEIVSRSAAYNGASLHGMAFERNALGRITRRVETLEGATSTWTYLYDDADRLVGVQRDGVTVESYAYDDNGNRVTGPAGESYAYDAQDRLLEFIAGGVTTTYTYTPNGERATRVRGADVTTYTYDPLGRMTSVELPDGTEIEYLYDGRGRRIGKRVDGTLVQGWLYADGIRPIAELDGAGNVVSRFVYAGEGSLPAYMLRGGATYRFIVNHVGSPRLVVDAATGAVVQRLDFDAFGRVTFDSNPGFQPFGFAGGLYDGDTGLVRFGHRDYDPEVGRWTTRDPLAFGGGLLNLYAYAANDPVNIVDRTGLEPDWFDEFVESASTVWDAVMTAIGVIQDADKIADGINEINKVNQSNKTKGQQAKDLIDDIFAMCEIVLDKLPKPPLGEIVVDFFSTIAEGALGALDYAVKSSEDHFKRIEEAAVEHQPAPEIPPDGATPLTAEEFAAYKAKLERDYPRIDWSLP